VITEILAINSAGDEDLKAAQGLLRRWDRKTDVNNRGTALAVLMGMKAIMSENNPTPLALPAALRAAIDDLKTHFGRIDPEWGEVNRIRRGKLDLPIDGGPDVYRAVYGVPQSDGTLTAAGGDTFIMFITWSKNGQLSSQSVHQFGSATLDASSRHYADQTRLFVAMKTKPVLFTEAELKDHVEADYRPGEKHAP
jgi:penicillin amidase/acyl-homoserine-lactone acylase